MRFVVLGAGAIGGVIGGGLHRAGHDVTLIARGAAADVLRSSGSDAADAGRRRGAARAGRHGRRRARRRRRDPGGQEPGHGRRARLAGGARRDDRLRAERRRERGRGAAALRARLRRLRLAAVPAPRARAWSRSTRRRCTACSPSGAFRRARTRPRATLARAFTEAGCDGVVSDDVMRLKRGKLLGNLINGIQVVVGDGEEAEALHEQAMAEARACFDGRGPGLRARHPRAGRPHVAAAPGPRRRARDVLHLAEPAARHARSRPTSSTARSSCSAACTASRRRSTPTSSAAPTTSNPT